MKKTKTNITPKKTLADNKQVTNNAQKPNRKARRVLKSVDPIGYQKDKEERSEELKKARNERKEMRCKRDILYESRRIASLKRRYKNGEKTPEELKKSIEELRAELQAIKRYDILMLFNPTMKAMIKECLINEKIEYTLLADNYCWIKDTDVHVLNKLREIMPIGTSICPYKAKPKPKDSSTESNKKKEKKPTNNTFEVKAKAKKERKNTNLIRFDAQHGHKLHRDYLKKNKIVTLADKKKSNLKTA